MTPQLLCWTTVKLQTTESQLGQFNKSGTMDLAVNKRGLLIEMLSEEISQKLLREPQVGSGLLCNSRARSLEDSHT